MQVKFSHEGVLSYLTNPNITKINLGCFPLYDGYLHIYKWQRTIFGQDFETAAVSYMWDFM